jgi:hypothetical protein
VLELDVNRVLVGAVTTTATGATSKVVQGATGAVSTLVKQLTRG